MATSRSARKDDAKRALTRSAAEPEEQQAPAQPPYERNAIREAFVARALAATPAGGGAESELGADHAALRGAYVAHLLASEPEALSGALQPSHDVLHDVYAARAAPARAKAKAGPASGRTPARAASGAPATIGKREAVHHRGKR